MTKVRKIIFLSAFMFFLYLFTRVGPDIRPDTGYWIYQAWYPVLSDIQPYFTEDIPPDIRQFSLLYQTKLVSSGCISSHTGYPAQPYFLRLIVQETDYDGSKDAQNLAIIQLSKKYHNSYIQPDPLLGIQ